MLISSKDTTKKGNVIGSQNSQQQQSRPQISPRVNQKVKTALDDEEDELLNKQGMGMPRMSDQIYAIQRPQVSQVPNFQKNEENQSSSMVVINKKGLT